MQSTPHTTPTQVPSALMSPIPWWCQQAALTHSPSPPLVLCDQQPSKQPFEPPSVTIFTDPANAIRQFGEETLVALGHFGRVFRWSLHSVQRLYDTNKKTTHCSWVFSWCCSRRGYWQVAFVSYATRFRTEANFFATFCIARPGTNILWPTTNVNEIRWKMKKIAVPIV